MDTRYLGVFLVIVAAILSHSGTTQAKDVDWGALNPVLVGATFVKDSAKCVECHEDYMQTYQGTKHDRVLAAGGCESCHGPMSKHLDAPKRKKLEATISFDPEGGLTVKQKASICTQCHEGGKQLYWQSGPHEASNVSCDSCHYVMERRSDKSLKLAEDAKTICISCHLEKKGQMLKSAHMPVKEGKMDCTSCHNPHGSSGPHLLKTATVNETCYTCHAEKRGPFLWEHAPVREDCSTCHDSHGSNNPGMLKTKGSFLCMSCHQFGGHPNVPRYNRVSSTIGQGCINCHNRIHGSNHPSGVKFTR
jgi:DmsE family decaheme c-type cytochrome